MAESARLVRVGLADPTGSATPIFANVLSLGNDVPVTVLLTEDYAIEDPAGFPFRPGMTGTDTKDLDYPRVLSAGVTMKFLKCEADALVAANVGTLA